MVSAQSAVLISQMKGLKHYLIRINVSSVLIKNIDCSEKLIHLKLEFFCHHTLSLCNSGQKFIIFC